MSLGEIVVCSLALVPVGLILVNLRLYTPLRRMDQAVADGPPPSVSVLIPARNEEENIRGILESVLASGHPGLEVLVLDDQSTDATAMIVGEMERRDPRVRLLHGGGDPEAGWAGKPWACQRLAQAAKGEVLLFLDADVRVKAEGFLSRVAREFQGRELDMLSGVPRQRLVTFWEGMFVPMIHFVLLGYLPFWRMRAARAEAFGAACGQLLAVRRVSYERVGGHSTVRESFHEGLKLARVFRRAGLVTDMFDASGDAECRMYDGFWSAWNGFAKNAHEGIASPRTLLPMSVLLLAQVVPFACVAVGGGWEWVLVCLGIVVARLLLCVRFGQPVWVAILHPVSVFVFLLNQWYGATRRFLGKPVGWRGRVVASCVVLSLSAVSADAEDLGRCPEIRLRDQNDCPRVLSFPRGRRGILVIADRSGSRFIEGWVRAARAAFGEQLMIDGLADVRAVPGILRPVVRASFRSALEYPVLMDWDGGVVSALNGEGNALTVLLLGADGRVLGRYSGEARGPELERFLREAGGPG